MNDNEGDIRCRSHIHIQGLDVPSGVAEQPQSDEETIQGALNRSRRLKAHDPQGLCIGLEGGVQSTSQGMMVCNWGVLIDEQDQQYIAGGIRIPLPREVQKGIEQGGELGVLMDRYAQQENVSKKEGAIGILSHGIIDRSHMFKDTVLLLIGQKLHGHYSLSKM